VDAVAPSVPSLTRIIFPILILDTLAVHSLAVASRPRFKSFSYIKCLLSIYALGISNPKNVAPSSQTSEAMFGFHGTMTGSRR